MQRLNGIGACNDNVATLWRSGPLDQAKDHQEDHGPQCGHQDAARNAPTNDTAKAAEQQTSDEGPDDSNHEITNQPKTTTLDKNTSQPACDHPDQQKPKKRHLRVQSLRLKSIQTAGSTDSTGSRHEETDLHLLKPLAGLEWCAVAVAIQDQLSHQDLSTMQTKTSVQPLNYTHVLNPMRPKLNSEL